MVSRKYSYTRVGLRVCILEMNMHACIHTDEGAYVYVTIRCVLEKNVLWETTRVAAGQNGNMAVGCGERGYPVAAELFIFVNPLAFALYY